MTLTTTRVCNTCHCEKPLTNFCHRSNGRIVWTCKPCDSAKSKAYYAANPGPIKARSLKWAKDNPEAHYLRVKLRRETHREKDREYKRNWKLRQGIVYRITEALRTRVRCAVRKITSGKSARTLDLIGCGVPDLITHLEKQFQSNMSWDNYGEPKDGSRGWEIDHIRPCASFDLTRPEQQKQCFHWSNLQPLWAEDNARKHAKFNDVSR